MQPITGTFTFTTAPSGAGGVQTYGAACDGATDDTAALRAAVTANRGGVLNLTGDCLITGEVPGVHGVKWSGGGRIIRDGWVFHVNPHGDQKNVLHVAPGGGGDGLTPGAPMGTFQEAFDALELYGPVIGGRWEIRAAEGVYDFSGGQQTLTTQSENTVLVCGPDVGGHPNVPVAVIDGTGGGRYSHGLAAGNGGVLVEFRDLKAVGFTAGEGDSTRCGFVGQNQATTNYRNVHVTGATWAGIYAFNTHRNIVRGGIFEDCRYGISNNDTQSSVGYPGWGAIFRRCTEFALHWSRGTQGHIDYNTFEDNAVGVCVEGNSRAAIIQCDFKRNNVGIRTRTGGFYGETSPNEFNTATADAQKWANVQSYDTSGDIQELDWALPERVVAHDETTRTIRNAGERVVLSAPYTLPANRLWGAGKAAQVRVLGTHSAPHGSLLEVAFGETRMGLTVPEGVDSSTAFEFVVDIVRVSGAYRLFGKLTQSGAPVKMGSTTGRVPFDRHAAHPVTVSATLTGGALHIYRTEVRITG